MRSALPSRVGEELHSVSGELKSASLVGGIAQLVERQLCKLEVRGSNPLASKIFNDLANERMTDCLTVIVKSLNHSIDDFRGPVAQLVRACA